MCSGRKVTCEIFCAEMWEMGNADMITPVSWQIMVATEMLFFVKEQGTILPG